MRYIDQFARPFPSGYYLGEKGRGLISSLRVSALGYISVNLPPDVVTPMLYRTVKAQLCYFYSKKDLGSEF